MFRVPDYMAHRSVKCPACENRFIAEVEASDIPAAQDPPAAPPLPGGDTGATAAPPSLPVEERGSTPEVAPAPAVVVAAREEPAAHGGMAPAHKPEAPAPGPEPAAPAAEPEPQVPSPGPIGKPEPAGPETNVPAPAHGAGVAPPPGRGALGPPHLAGAAVAVGLLGFLLAWAPGLRPAGLACGGLGLLLASTALGWAALTRRGGSLALAGLAVSLQTLALSVVPGQPRAPAESGPPAEPPKPPATLLEVLADRPPKARTEALAEVGGGVLAAVPDLVELLAADDPAVRASAASALGAIGPSARGAIPALLQAENEDKDREVQRAAHAALDRVGRYATEGDVPVLLAGLRAPHSAIFRAACAQVLWRVGTARAPGDRRPEERAALRSAVPALTERLRDQDGLVRLYAAQALLAVERDPQRVPPVLRDALGEDNVVVRTGAAKALTSLGRDARPAVQKLREVLRQEKDGGARLAEARALWVVDEQFDELVAALLQALQDPDGARRETAADIVIQEGDKLRAHGRPLVAPLVALLRDDQAQLRTCAAQALGQIGPEAGEAAEALGNALDPAREGNEEVLRDVARALYRLGPSARPALPALVGVLRHRDYVLRACAVAAVGTIGDGARDAVPELGKVLREDLHATVRLSAATALGKLGEAARPAVPALCDALKDTDRAVREAAADALLVVDRRAPAAILALGELLANDDAELRLFAAHALGRLGREAKAACGALHDAGIKETDDRARQALDEALARVGFPPTAEDLDLLLEAMKGNNVRYRLAAARVVAMLQPVPAKAVPGLRDALNGHDLPLRVAAAAALAGAGEEAAPAVPDLAAALDKGGDADLRFAAAAALGSVGPAAKQALEPLQAALRDPTAKVRRAAAYALGTLRGEARPAVRALVERLQDEDRFVILYAAGALALVEPAQARPAVPVLCRILLDEKAEADMRAGAADTLAALRMRTREVRDALARASKDRSEKVREAAVKALHEVER
jgi:HEAT repeat protein